MARPQFRENWSEPVRAPGSTDWDALRHDLESLLRQVENRQLQPQPATPHPLAPSSADPHARHQAALRSVQRAVERFTEPAPSFAPLPRDDLQTAISEIRARTSEPEPRDFSDYVPRDLGPRTEIPRSRYDHPVFSRDDMSRYTPRPAEAAFAPDLKAKQDYAGARYEPAPARAAAPPLDAPARAPLRDNDEAIEGLRRLTSAVSGMAGRLERVEADMRATRDASGDIAEVAAQVGQLTHVVELVAGAVGEQGHVKRLESQIAELARLYSDGPKPEIASLTRRIDELSATVERLADLQVQEIGRAAREAEGVATNQAEVVRAQGASMHAIEDGVRNIYDRIDALEQSYAIAPEDLDRLTREMGSVTAALRSSGDTETLTGIVGRLDAMSRQIDGMGRVGDRSVTALRDDVQALSDAVREVVEPRFAALESRIESLSSRVGVGAGAAPSTPSLAQLEEQIRRLAQRMDQTGQQLSGLTDLYKSSSDRNSNPDLEALAAAVAERMSVEMARMKGDDAGLDASSLDALEGRLSKLFTDRTGGEAPALLADVAKNLGRVDDRLNRLETALDTLARRPATPPAPAAPDRAPTPVAAPSPSVAPPPNRPSAQVQRPVAETAPVPPKPPFSEPDLRASTTRQPQLPDDMPRAPSVVRPLVDDELSALVAPVEDWSSIGLDAPAPQRSKAVPTNNLPGFDPAKIERPARPRSSFADEVTGFTPMNESESDMDLPVEDDFGAPSADRSTFIAAARRAVRDSQDAQASEVPQSLIGRALARFQATRKTAAPDAPAATPVIEPEFRDLPEGKASLDDFPEDIDLGPFADTAAATGRSRLQGLLGRHHRSLMLAGALVVTTLLAGNLIVQKLMPPSAPTQSTVQAPAPGGSGNALVDPTPTGSIDPFIKMNLTQPSPTRQILPAVLTPKPLSGGSNLDPTFTHSVPPSMPAPEAIAPAPIKLDLPPDSVGPLELRQAAADGDPRAQFEVGAIYTEGSAVSQDFKSAAIWYERSAAQGFAPAQYRLGNLYEHGNGLDKDLEQARLWYTRAAEAGNRMAMHNLASLYAGGELGDQQFAAAAEWFERAADAGMTDSQFNLGMLYARGLGVAQDLKASFKWFSLAAEAGDNDAAKSRDDIGKSLDPASLQVVKTEIANWHMTPINIPANFAPIGTWSPTFDPGQTITEKSVTKTVQQALARLGYDPGTVDGVTGPKTTQAIREFEQATGMNPTGLVNPRLLAVLGSQPV